MNRIFSGIQKANTWLQTRVASKGAILMYHSIAQPGLDPWGLSVTPQHFADHLEVIRQQAKPMSLQQLATAGRQGNVPDRAVAITFDDGYANNLYNAKPILERYNIPATVFIATGNLGAKREFWWDELEQALLKPGILPQILSLTVNGQLKQWYLGAAAHYSQNDYDSDRHRKAWEGQPNSRLAFYYELWDTLRTLPTEQRQVLQDKILNWANANFQGREDYLSLTSEELVTLEQGGVVEIGAHTVTHPSLFAHSMEFQRNEIHSSQNWLEQFLKHPIKSFAYPFGDFNRDSVIAVEECGFEQACTTIQQPVWKGSHRFRLPRFEVENWTKEVFEKQLNKWFN